MLAKAYMDQLQPITSEKTDVCECGGSDSLYDEETGDLICRSCGIVLNQKTIEYTPPRCYMDDEDEKFRNNKSYFQPDKVYYAPVRLNRKDLLNFYTRETTTRTRILAAETSTKCRSMNFSKSLTRLVMREVFKISVCKKWCNFDHLTTVMAYAVAKNEGFPVLQRDLEIFEMNDFNLGKALFDISEFYKVNTTGAKYMRNIVLRIMNQFEIPIKFFPMITNVANQSFKNTKGQGFNPLGILGAAVYTVSKKYKLGVKQAPLSKLLSVSEVTIRKSF